MNKTGGAHVSDGATQNSQRDTEQTHIAKIEDRLEETVHSEISKMT